MSDAGKTGHGHDSAGHNMDYEERDLPARRITIWVLSLMLVLVAVMGLMWVLFGTPKANPREDIVTSRNMTQPLLQVKPSEAFKKYREEQEKLLSSYGWVDKNQGIVRIPIQEAMDIVVRKGLPSRATSP